MALTFDEALAAAQLPEAAVAPFRKVWEQAVELITLNNKRIAQLNASKASDPGKPGYSDELDKLWRLHAPGDEKMAEVMAEFDVVAEAYEKKLAELREFAKGKIPAPLSDEETRNVKKLVNESSDAIDTAIASAAAMSVMFDGMLNSLGKGIEGGLISLMPQKESLKNLRGRKASGNVGGSNITRIGGFEIDGKPVGTDTKANLFRVGAHSLSAMFNAQTYAQNKVTGEEIEEAFYAAIGKELRSLSSSQVPESTTFDFTKEIKTGENTSETKTVKITIQKVATEKADDAKAEGESKADEKPVEGKAEKKDAPAEKKDEGEGVKISPAAAAEAKKAAASQKK